MPTITLDNGTEVHISQESYNALAKAVKPKELTYKKVAKKLFKKSVVYAVDLWGEIQKWKDAGDKYIEPNNSVSENQCKQLLALNKLFNVAYYLNEGWEPDWNNDHMEKHIIKFSNETICISYTNWSDYGCPYFKTKELAQKAIAILGEKSIKECFGIFE